jgi:hypothetical protein
MKHLSYWASKNIWLTRFLILLIYIVLNVVGVMTGNMLHATGIYLNQAFLYLCVALTILGVFIYPTHSKKISSPKLYCRHKTADAILGSATFLIVVFAGNQLSTFSPINPVNGASLVSTIDDNNKSFSAEHPKAKKKVMSKKRKWNKISFREWKKQIKAGLKVVRDAYRQDKNAERILLISLAVTIAVILILLLAALSCEIACAGAEALAIVLFVTGTFGIIFALVRIIQRINTKYNKLRDNKEPVRIQS